MLLDSGKNHVQMPSEEVVQHLIVGVMRDMLIDHPHRYEPNIGFNKGRTALTKEGIVLKIQNLSLISAHIGIRTLV